MKNKIYKQYKKELIERIKKKFKNHNYKKIMNNIFNNTTDDKILKFKQIKEERKKEKRRKKNKDSNEDNQNNFICNLCGNDLNVNIDHFKTKEHIDNFNKNIEISTNKSIEEKFIDVIFKFKITKEGAFLRDLHFKKIAKQKIRNIMNKNKKYKYNITFYKEVLDNLSGGLKDFTFSYNTEDVFKAIDTCYSDKNMLNTNNKNDKPNEELTKIRQKELEEKEKARLNFVKFMNEQKEKEIEESYEKNQKIKEIEHAEIKNCG